MIGLVINCLVGMGLTIALIRCEVKYVDGITIMVK